MGTAARSVALAMAIENRAQGVRIAELRDRRGLSQESFARLVGVSKGAVQNWEAGGGIRGENLRRAAETLGVTIEEITGQAEPVDPFSLAAHLDENVEIFERWCQQMSEDFARVEAKLDLLAAAMQPDPWTRMREAAERLAAAHADGAPQEPQAARNAKR